MEGRTDRWKLPRVLHDIVTFGADASRIATAQKLTLHKYRTSSGRAVLHLFNVHQAQKSEMRFSQISKWLLFVAAMTHARTKGYVLNIDENGGLWQRELIFTTIGHVILDARP